MQAVAITRTDGSVMRMLVVPDERGEVTDAMIEEQVAILRESQLDAEKTRQRHLAAEGSSLIPPFVEITGWQRIASK